MLTFDDGPNPQHTPRLLDVLQEHDVKACFFVVGSKVKQYPEIVKRMAAEGHTVGIHHYHHISNWILTPWQLKKQLIMTEQAIMECTHENVRFYRPPWGHFNLVTPFVSKKYICVMWSTIFGDWKVVNAKNKLLDGLKNCKADGEIILLHDCGETLGADIEAPRYTIDNLELFLRATNKDEIHFINLKEYVKTSEL